MGFSISICADALPVFQADLITGLEITYGSGAPIFTRPSDQYVSDWDGVYLQLGYNEFGIQGGRRVKNIFLNSKNAALWKMYDSSSDVTSITASYNLESVSGVNISNDIADGPYFYTSDYVAPGTIFSSRVTARNGAIAKNWVNQGRTWGSAIGSESNSVLMILDDTNWVINSQTLQNFESHFGHSIRLPSTDSIAGDIDVVHVSRHSLLDG